MTVTIRREPWHTGLDWVARHTKPKSDAIYAEGNPAFWIQYTVEFALREIA